MRDGVVHFTRSSASVLGRPIEAVAWLAVVPFLVLAGGVWGGTLVGIGWIGARREMEQDGLAGLGEALAPQLGRAQYAEGVWRGLWRAHTLSFAFALVQLLPILISLLPAAVALVLLRPAEAHFPPRFALLVATGIPALFALLASTVTFAQTLLAWRLLSEHGPRYSTGLVYAAAGAAWRTTLAHLRVLVGVGSACALGAVIVAVAVEGSSQLAAKLQVGAGGVQLVAGFTAFALALTLAATTLEALAAWAEEVDAGAVDPESRYSFTAWLSAWTAGVYRWFAARGLLAVGAAVCLATGLLVALLAIGSGQVFTSFVALGWFAVSAAVLVALSLTVGRRAP